MATAFLCFLCSLLCLLCSVPGSVIRTDNMETGSMATETGLLSASAFIACVVTVYALAAAAALRLWRQEIHKTVPFADRIVFALAALGFVCMAYGYFVEPYRLTISHVEIRSSK